MARATVGEIAQMVKLHPDTIRRWADRNIIQSKRDFNGWRIFPDPLGTVKRINGLLNGDIELDDLSVG
jgi:DNA-binding transcriptional MerR regulator